MGIGTVLVMILNTMYVSYASKKKAFGFQASIGLLKFLIWIFTQLLYFPVVQLFLSMFVCKTNSEGQSVHYMFPEVYCFSGEHFVLVVVLTITLLILLCYTLVASYLYFNFS